MSDREKLIEILSKYFDITDPYAYNLTRVKTAFAVGTMSLEDFEEFNEETMADIADYLIANGVGFLPCKLDGDRWYIPLSNGRKYCTSYEAKMKEV